MEEATLQYIKARRYLEPEDNIARIRHRPAELVLGRHRDPAPLVTVVIPAYRREALLRQALESALDQQGFTDYQILIVDDSALPAEAGVWPTEQLVREYDDERIVYCRNPQNLGLMDNWNMCYFLARSPWVCTLHDDDLLPRNFLEKMAAVVQLHPEIDALFNLANQFDGEHTSPEEIKALLAPVKKGSGKLRIQRVWRQNFGLAAGRPTGSFIKRDAFLKVGGFGVDRPANGRDIIYNDDYCLAVRLFANCRCYILAQNLYNYRTGANNGSARVKDYLPDLVQEYYLGRQISRTKCILWRWVFYRRNKFQAVRSAQRLDALVQAGGERMNREARVDFEALRQACGWKSCRCSGLEMRLSDLFWKGYSLVRRSVDLLSGYDLGEL